MADQNQVKVVESSQGQFRLNLSKADIAKVDVVDVDFVIQTKSGERIILAGAAIDSTGDKPPAVVFTDGQISSSQLFASVAQVQTLDVPVPAMASLTQYEAQKTKGPRSFVSGDEAKGASGDAAATAAADATSPASADTTSNVAPLSQPAPTTVETLMQSAKQDLSGMNNKSGDYTVPPSTVSTPSSSTTTPASTKGAQATVPQLPTLYVWDGNLSGSVTSGSNVYGASAADGADPTQYVAATAPAANSSLQIAPEELNATGNQTVYVDGVGPLLGATSGLDANATTSYAKVFVASLVGTYNTAGNMTISGVPTGVGFSLVSLDTSQYTIVDSGGGTWTVTLVDANNPPSKIAIKLIYPTTYTSQFTLDFSQQVSYDGLVYDLHRKIVTQIKEVHSTADLTVSATDPNDTTKTALVDVLPSNGVPNLVHVSGTNNTIYGGVADDTISTLSTAVNATSNTTFDGGSGIDTADFSNDSADLTINLAANAAVSATLNHGGSAEGSLLLNVEVVKGGAGNDTLTGNATTSTTISGGDGNDLMAGGTAGDTFDGGAGSDTVTYAGSATAVTIDLTGVGSNAGGAAGDSYVNVERVVGSTLADKFIGGTSSGSATMDGGGGSDWIDYSAVTNTRGVTVDLVNNDNNGGGALYDRLTAIPNIRGSSYSDLFYADGTANSFDGGAGTDVVSYAESSAGVTVDQSTTTNSAGYAAGDAYTNIESIVGTTGTDTFIGATATGSATMVGGGGTDWVSYQYATSAATLDLTGGANGGAASFDRLSGIENVLGSSYNDTFFADSAANSFSGGGGTDVVSYAGSASGLTVDQTGGGHGSGYASGDSFTGIATIIGSSLNDTFIGGSTSATSATMDGAGGSNWISYQYATSGATVDLTLNTTTTANGGSALYDHLINIENIRGSTLADTFYADSAANIFSGGGGSGLDVVSYTRSTVGLTIDLTGGGAGTGSAAGDSYIGIASVVGSTGADTFIGGTAANSATMVGGGGADWVDYSGLSVTNNYGVTVDLVTTSNNGRGALFDRLSDIPNIRGSAGNDLFYANGVANSLDGGDGIDVVSYAESGAGVTVDQTTGNHGAGYAAGDTYANIESIVGTTGADTFIGATATGSATMVGNGGTDWVSYQYATGATGATVDLTDSSRNGGLATYDSLSGIENIIGSSLADTFYADNRTNSFEGGDGTDIVSYERNGTVALTVDQTSGNHGTGYAAGDKYVNVESILGTTGADTFIGATATGSATMVGNGGADWLSYQYATSGATVDLTNTAHNAGAALYDRLSGVENILGSTLDDTFIADAAANSLTGNGGTDWVSYNAATSGVTVDLTRNANNGGWAAGDVLTGIENVIGSSYADTFYADSAANSFSGGGGAGLDVVSYTRSTAGLTIDQTTGGRGTGSASLDSYAGIASIVGTTGSDTFIGGTGAGSATMVGGGGNDWVSYAYVGSSATVTLGGAANTGAAAADHLSGVENIIASSYGDTLTGDTAANTFVSGAGADLISGGGGAGVDTVSYALDPSVVHVVNLATNVNTGGAAAGDHLYDIGRVIGGNAGDTLTGNATISTTLVGGTGADLLAGGSAADYFDGGAGTDIVTYANSAARVIVDQTSGGNGLGYAAGDVYVNVETIIGSTGDDTFIGGNGTNAATMAGGGGTDWVSYEYATRGATVDLTYNNTTSLNGGAAANDHLVGIENVRGSSFADTFVADGLGNSLDGGDGNDWVSYEKLSSPVTINLFTAINGGAALNDHLVNIENVKGTTGSDTFYANAQSNIFSGGGGAGLDVVSYDSSTIGLTVDQTSGGRGSGLASGDSYVGIATIVGSSLSDTFIGGTSTGSATMDGASGANWVTYQYASGTVNLNLGTGSNSGVAQYDHLVNVENIIASSGGGTLTGDANANSFIGGVGADTFIGGGGTDVVAYVLSNVGMVVDQTGGNRGTNSASGDSYSAIATIIGSTSIDTFIGGTSTGSATMVGGGGADWVSYAYASSGATLDLSNNTNNRGAALYDRLGGIENVWGSGYNDTFYADGSANSFVGGGGTDVVSYARTGLGVVINQTGTTLSTGFAQGDTYSGIASIVGSAGDDTFIGGNSSGAATMVGGGGTDWVTYANAATAATVDLTNSANNKGSATYDRLSGVENIVGSTAGDTFFADNSVNTFDGGAGTDVVSYAQSTAAGVSVDQTAGNHGAGYAAGDKYINIESIVGTTGNDTFFSSNGTAAATMVGNGGTDWVSYAYATSAATVDLTLNGTASTNSGSASADHLVGIENIVGSSLADTFYADSATNSFDGGAGTDIVSYVRSGATGVTVDQTAGNHGAGYALGDKFVNVESIVGTTGNDTFIGATSSGSATMVGNGGTDWVSYAYAASGATVNLKTGVNGGSAANDHLVNVENIVGSSLADTFYADGNSNGNTIDGGAGTDWVSYSALTGGVGVKIDLSNTANNGGAAIKDRLYNIENIIGSAYGDTLVGTTASDTFVGGSGADVFSGGGGSGLDVVTYFYTGGPSGLTIDLVTGARGSGEANGDTFSKIASVVGTTGNDTFIGATASGSATMVGNGGTDWITYAYAGTAATVDLTNAANNGGSASFDRLSGVENIVGSSLNDTFYADNVTNSFSGGAGTDIVSYIRNGTVALTVDQTSGNHGTGYAAGDKYVSIESIVGTTGADTFIGATSSGSATMVGNGGADWLSYQYATSGATVDLTSTASNAGAALYDRLSGIENILGSTLNDTFIADSSANSLTGNGGTDWVSYNAATSGVTVDLTSSANNGGWAAGDVLTGIDNVIGSSYADTFYGNTNTNSFNGGAGVDIVSYTRSTVGLTIDQTTPANSTGFANKDVFVSIESIVGTTGTDTFIGGTSAGSAVMVGGGGADWISYGGVSSNATVNLANNGLNGGKAANDRLSGVENIIASSYGDTLTGDTLANTFMSGAGADTITGGGGVDTVSYTLNSGTKHVVNLATNVNTGGWAAGDLLYGIGQLIGGNTGDTLTGNATTSTTLIGGAGDDLLAGGSAADSFDGGAGTDTVTYAGSAAGLTINLGTPTSSSGDAQGDILVNIEIVKGSTFSDTFIGGLTSGSTTMDGGGGTDWVSYGLLTGSTGVLVNLTTGTNGLAAAFDHLVNIENIIGSKNADTLTGDTAVNTIQAGSGDDTIIASTGGDYLDGGAGTDLVDYSSSASAMVVFLGAFNEKGQYPGAGAVGYSGYGVNGGVIDNYINIENITGTSSADTLIGSTGTNVILGGGGDDTIGGGGGGDTLDGGTGTNTLTYGWESTGVTIYLGGTNEANTTVSTHAGYGMAVDGSYTDYLANFKNVIGSKGADKIVGTASANTFSGNGGADTIYGMSGNDYFIASQASETLDGGADVDTVDYSAVTTAMTVDLSGNTAHNQGSSFTDTLYNIENVYGSSSSSNLLIGDAAANSLTGGSAGDVLKGGAGNDILSGGGTNGGIDDTLMGESGNDTLIGGVGTETLDGGVGIDMVDYHFAASAVTVDLVNGTATNAGGSFSDTLISIESILGTNSGDSFTMSSTQLAGLLSGGTLDGGGGSDTLTCAGGNLDAVASHITNIETVNVKDGVTNSFTLTASDIQHIVGQNTSSDLDFTIDSYDTFTTSASDYATSTVSGSTIHYDFHTGSVAGAVIAQLELHKV